MVPAGVVAQTLTTLVPLLDPDDVVIDGGNSYYRDDLARSAALKEKGIHFLDVGTSGGVWGLERGYCLMIGGNSDAVQRGSIRSSTRSPPVSGPSSPRRGACPLIPRRPRATCTAGRPGPGTSSRWCTTASSTA